MRDANGRFCKVEKVTEEKVYMHGFKGFGPGMVCAPNGNKKQYAENTTYEEPGGKICDKRGGVMHFCENPLAVFGFYAPADDGKINEFAMVDALAPTQTDDGEKFCTTKLRVNAKIGLGGVCQAAIEFVLNRVDKTKKQSINNDTASNTGFQSAASNTGFQSAASNTGDYSAASNTGDYSAASNTGDYSAASVSGRESFAIAIGRDSKARGALGCWIACAEWDKDDSGWHPVDFKAVRIDGEKIKADTWYKLVNGKFVEASKED